MNCSRARERLSEYIDARLTLERQREIERHLARCLACRQQVAELRGLKALLARAREPVAPAVFWDQIYASLPRANAPVAVARTPLWSRWLWQRAPGLAGAAALLLLAAVVPLYQMEATPVAAVAMDQLLWQHASACVRLPLVDRNRVQFIAADARARSLAPPAPGEGGADETD
jgi:anti-sigma factor RsiW